MSDVIGCAPLSVGLGAPRLLAARAPAQRFRALPDGRQVVDDHPRDGDHGYTTNPGTALLGEPEAVSAEVQEELTLDAGRRATDRRRAAWEQTRARIARERDYLAAQLRARERELARLERRLASA